MIFFVAVLLCCLPARQPLDAVQAGAAPGVAANLAAPPLPEVLRFEHFTTEDGLSQSTVFFISQDRQGFLWIGTQDGLNRYDGYHFSVFRNDPANPDSLSHNAVLCMQEDWDGNLWFGTWGGGLNRYDPQTGIFTRYRHDPADPGSLSNDTVAALALDDAGRLLAGTMGGGLSVLNPREGTFSHYRAAVGDADALGSDYISSILVDPGGEIWLGTGGFGVYGSGLYRLDPGSGKAVHYTLSSNTISSLALDPAGYLWIGTGGYTLAGRGLNRLDTRSGRVTYFQHDPADMDSLGSNDILSLYLDSSNILWIATWGGGLDRLNVQESTPSFMHYRHNPYDPYSLNADTIWSIFQDRSGVLWFGSTIAGLNKINPLAQRFHLYRNNPVEPMSLAGNAVGSFIEDREGNIWVGTLGFGLDRFDRENASFHHHPASFQNTLRQQANTYQALYEDRAGVFWVGTAVGLAQFDRTNGFFVYYYHDPQNLNSTADQISAIAEDETGRLWVTTQQGLDWFDRAKLRFVHMEIAEAGPGTDIYLDDSGNLWFGTQGKGLFQLDLSTVSGSQVDYTWYHNAPGDPSSLGDDTIVDIFGDRSGALWLATGRGLDRLDRDTRAFTHYRVENGLVSNNVLCILEDDQDRLWVSTNMGISRFDVARGQFRTFDALDGLQGSEFTARSCLLSRDGNMYFGGGSGLSAFNPQEIQDNPFPPPVAVTGFRVNNQPFDVDLSGETPVKLAYWQDSITFEFVALDFHIPRKNQLAYRLDGVDQDWVKADIGRYASYTNLPGGTFVFRVRGANNDGVWNEQEVAIPIDVAVPFWETRWFAAGSLLLLAGMVALGVRAYLENVRVQNRRLEALVEQRTTVLRQTNERLQQEIEQREKVEAALAQKAAEEAVAAERSRLARDLHDAVTQTLFSASLTAEVLPDLWKTDPDEALNTTEDLRLLTRSALAEMRTLLLELRPAALTRARYDDLLRQLTEAVIGRARLPLELRITGQRSLPPEAQVALYRIAQEALNNIVKYAKATLVCVDLQMSPAGLLLSIQDNGCGFDPAIVCPNSLGLRIMRERAEGIGAYLVVKSAPGQGTLVEVAWNDPDIKELA